MRTDQSEAEGARLQKLLAAQKPEVLQRVLQEVASTLDEEYQPKLEAFFPKLL